MKSIFKKIHRNQNGSAAIEFALLAPAVFLILFGIINYGIVMFNQSVITNAAREGARWAAIHTTENYGTGCSMAPLAQINNPCQAAYSYAFNSLVSFDSAPNLNLQIIATTSDPNYGIGALQTVKVTYSYKSIGWWVLSSDPTGSYSSTAAMLHE